MTSDSSNQYSFWEKDVHLKPYDCIIVGGGIVGCNAALSLKEQKPTWRVAIIDKTHLPFGASSKNAGFATFGSISEILSDVRSHGMETAVGLIKKRWVGLQALIARIGEESLELNWSGGHELFLESDDELYQSCLQFLPALNSAIENEVGLIKAFTNQPNGEKFGMSSTRFISNQYEGQLHPGKMMKKLLQLAIASGVEFIGSFCAEHHRRSKDLIYLVSEAGLSISTHRLAFASNGFSQSVLPQLDVQPARNQVLLTEEIPDLQWEGSFHYNEGYLYWRNVGRRILIGGARNLDITGETTDQLGKSDLIQAELHRFLFTHILNGREVEVSDKWSGILGVGVHKTPIIEEVEPSVYAGVRLGGMGVAIGTLVGQELAQRIVL